MVVNDLNQKAADQCVKEILASGGLAIANYDNVATGGQNIVKRAVDKWKRVDVLVNNAGIIRDKSFAKMTDQQWDEVISCHIMGTYKTCKAVWPIFQ